MDKNVNMIHKYQHKHGQLLSNIGWQKKDESMRCMLNLPKLVDDAVYENFKLETLNYAVRLIMISNSWFG